MKYLKLNANMADFINTVHQCRGEVLFQTEDGDSLNLKSVLSCYLFSMISANHTYLLSGVLICHQEEDYELLSDYIYEA